MKGDNIVIGGATVWLDAVAGIGRCLGELTEEDSGREGDCPGFILLVCCDVEDIVPCSCSTVMTVVSGAMEEWPRLLDAAMVGTLEATVALWGECELSGTLCIEKNHLLIFLSMVALLLYIVHTNMVKYIQLSSATWITSPVNASTPTPIQIWKDKSLAFNKVLLWFDDIRTIEQLSFIYLCMYIHIYRDFSMYIHSLLYSSI